MRPKSREEVRSLAQPEALAVAVMPLRIFAALTCAVIATLALAPRASAQAPLDRIEWFV